MGEGEAELAWGEEGVGACAGPLGQSEERASVLPVECSPVWPVFAVVEDVADEVEVLVLLVVGLSSSRYRIAICICSMAICLNL